MAISDKHPLYIEAVPDWVKMRDCFAGERRIKEQGFDYLPATAGMLADGALAGQGDGWEAYKAYRDRARFPDFTKEAIKSLIGVMHREPPQIELPAKLEPLREKASRRGESLEMLLRRVNTEQLLTGRLALLADITDGQGTPFLSLYHGEDVINWDEGLFDRRQISNLQMVVLNESGYKRTGPFQWTWTESYRVLALGDLSGDEDQPMTYRTATFNAERGFSPELLEEVRLGSVFGVADEIPFVFINANDVVASPEAPPLLGLANVCLGIYRGEADYRQTLFMQGQNTLVVMGGRDPDGPLRVGADARLELPINGDAKYIGVEAEGLSEQRLALENDRKEGAQISGQLLDSVSRERESGDALKVRVAARTCTINQVALAGAHGFQEVLRKLARWMGADPEQVVINPNLDFVDDQMTGKELAEWMGAKTLRAPVSMQTIHKLMEERGVTDLSFEEELQLIEEEQEQEMLQLGEGSTDPDGPEEDEEDDEDDADGDDEDDDEDGA